MSRLRRYYENDLDEHVEMIKKYLQDKENSNSCPPSILQVKFELGYDLTRDLGIKCSGRYNNLFEEVISYMVDHNDISIERDTHGVTRIHKVHPKEEIMWDVMYRFCIFLEEKWKKGKLTRFMFMYEQFSTKEDISRRQFDQMVLSLEDLELVEILSDERKMIRLIKPSFQNS